MSIRLDLHLSKLYGLLARLEGEVIGLRTIKRKAKAGEKIVITDAQKGWNGNDNSNGAVMTVTRVIVPGVYTEEMSAIYVNHDGYEVIEEVIK